MGAIDLSNNTMILVQTGLIHMCIEKFGRSNTKCVLSLVPEFVIFDDSYSESFQLKLRNVVTFEILSPKNKNEIEKIGCWFHLGMERWIFFNDSIESLISVHTTKINQRF